MKVEKKMQNYIHRVETEILIYLFADKRSNC